MAMIEIDLDQFVDDLIAEKPRGVTVDEARRARIKRELLAVADKAVDVAIMEEAFRNFMDGLISKGEADRFYDLMRAGSKTDTDRYVRSILPEEDIDYGLRRTSQAERDVSAQFQSSVRRRW